MINNRQAGRRRGRGGQQQRPQGGSGRPDNGNRIDNRARGNAAQLLEKYKTLARDAQMQGDRVNVEYYLQFADHYFRVLAETRARFEENGGAPSTRRIQGATLDEDEPDYEEEDRAADQARGDQGRNDQGRNDQGRNDQGRGDQNRNQNNGGEQQNRGDQQRYRQEGQNGRQDRDGNRTYQPSGQQGGQQNAPSEQRGNGQDYDDRPRGRVNGNGSGDNQNGGYERQGEQQRDERGERPARNDRYERNDRVARPVERAEESAPVQADPIVAAPVEEPRRGRGRPRRDAAPVAAPVRATGGEDEGFLSSLPPSLNVSAVTAPEADNAAGGDVDGAEKPRRRRGRPPASEAGTPG